MHSCIICLKTLLYERCQKNRSIQHETAKRLVLRIQPWFWWLKRERQRDRTRNVDYSIQCTSIIIKIRVVDDLNVVHRKIRIRARTDKLNTLLVAVTGFRKYPTLEDLRLNTFAHGQEIGLPQLAIQETTFARLELTFKSLFLKVIPKLYYFEKHCFWK